MMLPAISLPSQPLAGIEDRMTCHHAYYKSLIPVHVSEQVYLEAR
jgi:hypothetical protein